MCSKICIAIFVEIGLFYKYRILENPIKIDKADSKYSKIGSILDSQEQYNLSKAYKNIGRIFAFW